MDTTPLLRLQPTMGILQEALEEAGFSCTAHIRDRRRTYRAVCEYFGQKNLREDVLYLLRPEQKDFPTDQYGYLSLGKTEGQADHLYCPEAGPEEILERLFDLFVRYQDWEQQIQEMTHRNGGLQELCQLGSQLLGNPVCIHDEWMLLTAMSWDMEQMLRPEQVAAPVGEIPRMMLGDFRHDTEYLETYINRTAQIW